MAKLSNLLDEIKKKAGWELVKFLLTKLGVFAALGVIAALITGYLKHAPAWEIMLVGFGVFIISLICRILWLMVPTKSNFRIKGSSQSGYPPAPYVACNIVIENRAEDDAEGIEVELISAEGYQASNGMPQLPFKLAPNAYSLNPGAVTSVQFMKAPRGEEHTANGVLPFVDGYFGAMGGFIAAPCMRFEVNRDYRLVFKITAKKQTPAEAAFYLRFDFGGEPVKFGYSMRPA